LATTFSRIKKKIEKIILQKKYKNTLVLAFAHLQDLYMKLADFQIIKLPKLFVSD